MSISTAESDLLGFFFILFYLGLIIGFSLLRWDHPLQMLREISAFAKLRRSIGLAVEAGQRLHISLGDGGLQEMRGGAGLIGLSVISRVSRNAAVSDRPPIATSGEASLSILSQDALRSGYREAFAEHQFQPSTGYLAGVTPMSYIAGALPVIYDENASVNLFLGSFGSEVALLTDAAERTESLTIGGSDNLTAQAVIFGTVPEPLIGEDFYAAGAYLQVGKMHLASLLAQDSLRWVLILLLILGSALKFAGLL